MSNSVETDLVTDESLNKALDRAQEWYAKNWSSDLVLSDWWQKLGSSGWGFPAWPQEYGGQGLPSAVARQVVSDRMQRGVFGPRTGIATFLAAPTILTHGTHEQKERFLPGIVSGQDVWCQLFSEPGAGSDLSSLQTRAVRDGDEWIITGQKVWTSGAHFAKYGILIARTDSDVPKHKGLTYFLIEMQQPGIEIRPLREMTGESAFNEVFMNEARVHDDNRLGDLGQGWAVAMTTLSHERDSNNPGVGGGGGTLFSNPDVTHTVDHFRRIQNTEVDAFSFATSGGITEVLNDLVKEFKCANDPVIRQRLMKLHSMRETQKWTAQRAKANARAGAAPGPETSTLKLQSSLTGRVVRDLGFDIIGAHGMLLGKDAPAHGLFHKFALFVQATSIAGGSDEVQRNIIGERALGLPKEPDDSRDKPFRELRVGTQKTKS